MTVTMDEIEFPSLSDVRTEPLTDETPGEDKPKTRRRRSDAGQPRGTRSAPRATNTAKLEKELLTPIAMVARAVSFSLPTVGAVLIARGEVTAKGIVAFAQGHPKMLEALGKVGKVGPATEVAETVAMVIIAANVDLQKMHPEHPVAVLTGVSSIHHEIHGHMQQAQREQTKESAEAPEDFTPNDAFANIPPPPDYIMEGYNADGTYSAPGGAFRAGQSAAMRNDE